MIQRSVSPKIVSKYFTADLRYCLWSIQGSSAFFPPFCSVYYASVPQLEEMKMQEEEAAADGNNELLSLTAAVLLPLEPMV